MNQTASDCCFWTTGDDTVVQQNPLIAYGNQGVQDTGYFPSMLSNAESVLLSGRSMRPRVRADS